jgi:hypothetical protein
VSGARKLLIFGGVALAAVGMLYGLYYAVFVEHQTLDSMGGSLAGSFVHAAEGDLPEAHSAIDAYAAVKYKYVRQVDVHSHWIGLGMLMIVMGAVYDRVRFSERIRFCIAIAFLAGSVGFPLGVILQTVHRGGVFPSVLAVGGSALVTMALFAAAIGFARQSA